MISSPCHWLVKVIFTLSVITCYRCVVRGCQRIHNRVAPATDLRLYRTELEIPSESGNRTWCSISVLCRPDLQQGCIIVIFFSLFTGKPTGTSPGCNPGGMSHGFIPGTHADIFGGSISGVRPSVSFLEDTQVSARFHTWNMRGPLARLDSWNVQRRTTRLQF